MKETLIKKVSPKSYLDYVPKAIGVFTLVLAFYFEFVSNFENSFSIALGFYFSAQLTWYFLKNIYLFDDINLTAENDTNKTLDLSYKTSHSLNKRLFYLIIFILFIGFTYWFFGFNFTGISFQHFYFVPLVLVVCLPIIQIILKKEKVEKKIFNLTEDRLYVNSTSYVLLDELKEIRIGNNHLSFVPKYGKLEMLNDLELNEEEKEELKSFLEKHLTGIEISLYENREELFEDAAMK